MAGLRGDVKVVMLDDYHFVGFHFISTFSYMGLNWHQGVEVHDEQFGVMYEKKVCYIFV